VDYDLLGHTGILPVMYRTQSQHVRLSVALRSRLGTQY